MAKVDPAHFVVRRDTYEQLRGYPEACAKLTEELLRKKPASFSEAFDYITERMTGSPVLNRDNVVQQNTGFGRIRTQNKGSSLDFKFSSDAAELKRKHKPGSYVPLTYKSPAHPYLEKGVGLSKIDIPYSNGETHVYGADKGAHAEFEDEHRWSIISHKFAEALDDHKPAGAREEAALECFALIGHDRPYVRGNSTLAQVVLQYLAHEAKFTVPMPKEDVDLHTKSITRPVEEFVHEWKNGDYFDKAITAKEVMGWHKRRAVSGEAISII